MDIEISDIRAGDTVTLANGEKHVIGIRGQLLDFNMAVLFVNDDNFARVGWLPNGTSKDLIDDHRIVEVFRPNYHQEIKPSEVKPGDILILRNKASRVVTAYEPASPYPLISFGSKWDASGKYETHGKPHPLDVERAVRYVEPSPVTDDTLAFAFYLPPLPDAKDLASFIDAFDLTIARSEDWVQIMQEAINARVEAIAEAAVENLSPAHLKAFNNHAAFSAHAAMKKAENNA